MKTNYTKFINGQSSRLTQENIDKLVDKLVDKLADIGFVVPVNQCTSFQCRLVQLAKFKQMHNTTMVPCDYEGYEDGFKVSDIFPRNFMISNSRQA